MGRHPGWVTAFLSEEDLAAVARAVRRAEARTSAEVRVHVDHTCEEDALRRAVKVFERLGVLIYVSVTDHELAVIGDAGIHERVGEIYWRELVDSVRVHLRQQRSRDGLIHAVEHVGETLGRHFPRRPDDVNELPDDVSVGR